MENKLNPKISVIIPIYNVEEYLEECILSVINQNIGFEDNIELILVNDGSPDNSEEICLKYKDLYPNNINYIKKKNGGVSSARNLGLENAHGEFINFLDSDDKWAEDAFYKAIKMFEHHSDIDLIGIRQKFFDASDSYHVLDYKFNKDKIVDLSKDYDQIQLSSASCLIRRSAIGDLKFDTNLKYSEDIKFITEILLKKQKMGILASTLYLYRKRINETSAIQTKNANESWYLDTPKYCYKYLIDLSKKQLGYVHPYVQYCIAYDYQWRISEEIPESIYDKVIKEYVKLTKELLKDIDANIILEQKKLYRDYKVRILKGKYEKDFDKHITFKDGIIYFDDKNLYNITNSKVLKITNLKINDNKMHITGMINSILKKDEYEIFIKVNGKKRKIDLVDTKRHVRKAFNTPIYHNMGFSEEIDIPFGTKIKFIIKYKDEEFTLKPTFGIFAKLHRRNPAHYITDGYSIRCKRNTIYCRKSNHLTNFLEEFYYYIKLLCHLRYKHIIYRFIYHILKLFKRKDIWLISDRTMVANDNGMHLFKYVTEHNKKDEVYYVLNSKSKDYENMKKIGKVIPHGSFKYKMYFLLSKYVISSQADAWVYNPFGKSYNFYKDLFHFKLVFLQHGITQNDISDWLNVYSKDFSMFVTAAKGEYDSIVNGKDYGYGPDIVKLTGFPRYDNLKDDSKKQIAFMPTWRQSIAGKNDVTSGIREYNENFKNSDYFKFYNDLINDEKLLSAMRKGGYKGIFVIHPSHMKNYKDFQGNDVFEVTKGFADYQKIFKESNLLVTDYSSVHFDFAYMNKPVVYTQFDKENFYAGHIYEAGYFSYDNDGFGPVTYNYDDSLKEIIKIINNDCKMDKKYKDRVSKFYKYRDTNNCKRVYENILKIK